MNSFKRWLSIKKHKNARLILLIGIIVFNLLLWLVSSLIAFLSSPGSYGNAVEALWRTGITWIFKGDLDTPEEIAFSPEDKVLVVCK